MDKKTALEEFYCKNNIKHELVSDEDSAEYDYILSNLDDKIDKWLSFVDESDREAFLQVLSKYTYFTETVCQKRYSIIVDKLIESLKTYGIKLSEVLFITVESTNGTKSGSEHICADFYKRNIAKGIHKSQIISSFSRFDINLIKNYKAIVFLEDIVGTGFTLSNTIRTVIKELSIKTNTPNCLLLYAACLVVSKRGKRMIDKNAQKNSYEIKWLTDEEWKAERMFKKNSLEYNIFQKYESLIDKYIDDEKHSCFMGFDKCKFGISFHYDTPNNTLSTFWCETDLNKPPFKRDGNQHKKSLSIDDLKHVKKQTDTNAYNAAIMRQQKYE